MRNIWIDRVSTEYFLTFKGQQISNHLQNKALVTFKPNE